MSPEAGEGDGGAAPRPLRVLHVLAPARVGGLESVVTQLASGLAVRGHHVQVAAVLAPGTERAHPFVEGLRDAAVVVHPLVLGGRAYGAERRAVAALAAAMRADVLHTHGYRPDVLHGVVARRLGAAHVTTLHGFTGGGLRNRCYEWLQVRAARRADLAIAVSSVIEQRLSGVRGPGRVVLVRNAASPVRDALDRSGARQALGLPPAAFVIGFVGRLDRVKGADVFLEAVARLGPSCHAAMIGDGALMEPLRARAAALGLGDRLHFVGMRPGASRLLAAFDVLASTSRSEGTPMALLEAMWAGVPVVATAVGGVPDVIGDAGRLCPSEDVAAIATAINALATDEAARTGLAAMALARVTTLFDRKRWLDAHEQLYRGLVEGATQRPAVRAASGART